MKRIGALLVAALALFTLTGCPPGGMHPPVLPGDREYDVLIFVHMKTDRLPSDRSVGVIATVNASTSDGRAFVTPVHKSVTTPWTYHIVIPGDFKGIVHMIIEATWPHIQRFGQLGDVFGCDFSPVVGRSIKGNSRQVGNSAIDELSVDCSTILTLQAVA